MTTESEIKEFNDFLQESPVRNKFLPVMLHICKLKPKKFDVEEWTDKLNRPVVKFLMKSDQDRDIEGRVCFDWAKGDDTDSVIFEFWWDEECYCLLYKPIQAQNMVSCLLGKLKDKSPYISKTIRKSEELLPLEES